jgi:hypothetical protein
MTTPIPDYAHFARAERAKHKAEREALRRAHHARVDALRGKVLDRVEGLLDQLAPKPVDKLPQEAARRYVAQATGVPLMCSRKACRRTGLCRGEPKHCLALALPFLPPSVVAQLALNARKTRRGKARGL